ncbi:hypothetical protein SPBRAN_2014 [uncultured Candidatus Thioglobus sp.]|nr:hypothetical protein SPBRAN_2014 [uncultured Candidatus Thioglobus sp.]
MVEFALSHTQFLKSTSAERALHGLHLSKDDIAHSNCRNI